jgi:Family of unknown function (DUF5763)
MSEKPRCKALTKTGKPCKAAPTSNGLCFFHAFPEKARELGRLGGRNHRAREQSFHAVHGVSMTERTEQLYSQLENKSITPSQANAMIKILELQLKIQERSILPKEVANLNEALARTQSLMEMRDHKRSVSEYLRHQEDGNGEEDIEGRGEDEDDPV